MTALIIHKGFLSWEAQELLQYDYLKNKHSVTIFELQDMMQFPHTEPQPYVHQNTEHSALLQCEQSVFSITIRQLFKPNLNFPFSVHAGKGIAKIKVMATVITIVGY